MLDHIFSRQHNFLGKKLGTRRGGLDVSLRVGIKPGRVNLVATRLIDLLTADECAQRG